MTQQPHRPGLGTARPGPQRTPATGSTPPRTSRRTPARRPRPARPAVPRRRRTRRPRARRRATPPAPAPPTVEDDGAEDPRRFMSATDFLDRRAGDADPGPATWGWRGWARRWSGGLVNAADGRRGAGVRPGPAHHPARLRGPAHHRVHQSQGRGGEDDERARRGLHLRHRSAAAGSWPGTTTRPGAPSGSAAPGARTAARPGSCWRTSAGSTTSTSRGSATSGRSCARRATRTSTSWPPTSGPSVTGMIHADDFNAVHRLLERFYRLVLVDTGNNMRAENWLAAADAADLLVVTSTVREDTGYSGLWMLDALQDAGYQNLKYKTVTVLSTPRTRSTTSSPATWWTSTSSAPGRSTGCRTTRRWSPARWCPTASCRRAPAAVLRACAGWPRLSGASCAGGSAGRVRVSTSASRAAYLGVRPREVIRSKYRAVQRPTRSPTARVGRSSRSSPVARRSREQPQVGGPALGRLLATPPGTSSAAAARRGVEQRRGARGAGDPRLGGARSWRGHRAPRAPAARRPRCSAAQGRRPREHQVGTAAAAGVARPAGAARRGARRPRDLGDGRRRTPGA